MTKYAHTDVDLHVHENDCNTYAQNTYDAYVERKFAAAGRRLGGSLELALTGAAAQFA